MAPRGRKGGKGKTSKARNTKPASRVTGLPLPADHVGGIKGGSGVQTGAEISVRGQGSPSGGTVNKVYL
jgi:hypothetical protein